MKPTILILLMALSLHSVSQSRFSKRKYMKGAFIEKITHVKQKKATQISPSPYTSLACGTTMEEEKAPPETKNMTIRHDTVIAAAVHEYVDSASLAKHPSKAYAGIIKHNTLKLSEGDIYCLNSRPLVAEENQGMLRQKLETNSIVIQNMSEQTMMGNYFEDLLEGLKRFLLICLLVIMVVMLVASIAAITTYPVASASWILGLGGCLYTVMGIFISIASLIGKDGGKFMTVLKFIFLIVSFALIFTVGAAG